MRCLWLVALTLMAGPLRAVELPTELYNLDFTPPEVGSYEIGVAPPSFVASVGPMTDALIFEALGGYQQIRLPIGMPGPRFDIQYDVFSHNLLNSQHGFELSLDTPEVRNVSLHGRRNEIRIFQPFSAGGAVAPLANDRVYHFHISIDFERNLWTVALDGVEVFANPVNASGLASIRFTLSPVIVGAPAVPGTYAALDNIVVTVVPEPTALSLLTLGSLALLVARRRR